VERLFSHTFSSPWIRFSTNLTSFNIIDDAKMSANSRITWTPEDDEKLTAARLRGSGWVDTAAIFGDRDSRSCSNRWFKLQLKANWSDEEDEALRQAMKDEEKKFWEGVAGRIDRSVTLCKKRAAKLEKQLNGAL